MNKRSGPGATMERKARWLAYNRAALEKATRRCAALEEDLRIGLELAKRSELRLHAWSVRVTADGKVHVERLPDSGTRQLKLKNAARGSVEVESRARHWC